MAQEKQNTKDTIKKRIFFNGANFVKATKFLWEQYLLEKEKDTLRFGQSTTKKVLSPVGCTATKKRRGNSVFFF